MQKEYVFTDLENLVIDKNALTTGAEYDKWLILPYEAGEYKGKMLVGMDTFRPVDVELNVNVKGWYKIYFGLVAIGRESRLGVQISGGGKTVISPDIQAPHWQPHEWVEENFFRAADLTGKTIKIFKPDGEGKFLTSGLAYVRLVAMSKQEIADYTQTQGGCVAFHFDTDFTHEIDYDIPTDYVGRMEMLENTHGGELFYETSFDDGPIIPPKNHIDFSIRNQSICKRYASYLQNGATYRKTIIQKAHDMGYQIYATNRMEMGDFNFPYSIYSYNNGLAEQYPEYKCKTRDGRTINALSFAYPKVRAIAIERLMKMLADGFDGLGLIFHRGVHVAFEQPVIDRVQQLYGVDARRLPFADERLHTVLCEFMTQFMRELKAAVQAVYGDNKKINVIVYYDAESSKNFGLDTQTWAKENLIDGVCQGLMTHFEELDNCLGNDGLIDLEKFKKENAQRPVLCRMFSGNKQRVLQGTTGFMEICQAYGKQFYGSLLWEGDSAEGTWEIAQKLKKLGVKKFLSWNSNHKARNLHYLNTEKAIARNGEPEPQKYARMLYIADGDISSFNQNWRG